MASPNMMDKDYVAPPGDPSGYSNYVWEGGDHNGQWITIDQWHSIHDAPSSGGGDATKPPASQSGGGGDVHAPENPVGGVIPVGGGNDPYHNWNGGSPPNAALEAGRGWVWEGDTWRQATGTGLGYVPTGGGGGGGGGGAGGGGGYQSGGFGGYNPGNVPDFNAPRWQAPPEFAYTKQFQKPNAQNIQEDPSFQFRLDQGRQALEQSAAGKGVLRTGGTLKDLVNYGQNFATNEYSNIYNRNFNEYKFDYDKEADIYARNYNLNRDVFDRNYKSAYDEYAPKLRGWEVNANNQERQQEALFNRDWQKYMFDYNKDQQDMGVAPIAPNT